MEGTLRLLRNACRTGEPIADGPPRLGVGGRIDHDSIEPTLINGRHTHEESTFFVRGSQHGVIPEKMRVEDVLRVLQPIAFDAPDDEPVSLLIFLLVPEAATQRHLEILSEIAEMLSDRALREKLKTQAEAGTLHQLIADWQPLKSVA